MQYVSLVPSKFTVTTLLKYKYPSYSQFLESSLSLSLFGHKRQLKLKRKGFYKNTFTITQFLYKLFPYYKYTSIHNEIL